MFVKAERIYLKVKDRGKDRRKVRMHLKDLVRHYATDVRGGIMKKLMTLVMCMLLFGCAAGRSTYRPPIGQTSDDLQKAWIRCGGDAESGGFLMGPLIILAPIVVGVEVYRKIQRNKVQECMEAMGYRCEAGCPEGITSDK
jgi:hypothetical protein